MSGSGSSRLQRIFGWTALLSTVWAACSIFIPYGYPWLGLGWVGLALAAALSVRFDSTHLQSGWTSCELARLTPSEAASIPPEAPPPTEPARPLVDY